NRGYSVVATLPDEDSCYLEELPIEQPIALLFGTELTGLSPEAIQLADQTVKIPMYGFTTSFNISNSVAIILSFLAEKLRKSTINWRLSEEEKEELYFEWLQKSVKTPKLLIRKFLTENGLQL
ncbi:MAG TPA: TrmH family RNA methyltransferase, partial [Bacteroidales bacterium]|nr:TrmH family RNA methyltransferase [Bacteroidales bacterium]